MGESWHASRYVGSYRDGPRRYAVEIEATIAPIHRTAQTITHGTAGPDDMRLSIMGTEWIARKDGGIDRRYADCESIGQIVDRVPWERMLLPRDLSRRDLMTLVDIWRTWHLNDMRALCAHQSGPWQDAADCPVTGYRAGSTWLVAPVPPEVLTEVRRIVGRAK